MKVVYFQRKAGRFFSVERVFADVRTALPGDIAVEVRRSRFESQGFWRRAYNVIEAARHQGDVNHVTGDVHFLTYFMDRRRTVLTVLDCVTLKRLSGLGYWAFWVLWYWLPVRRCHSVTVISESTKQELLRYLECDPARVHVIHCPVSDGFQPDRREFNSSRPRLLQVGTTQNKNIERVAEALRGLPCTLVVVGALSESQRTALEGCAIDYENPAGLSDEELREQYRQADMLVFASTYEGFGLPIVEANAVGRPVVTSNLYSMPEVAGDAACLVDPYDVASIRASILRVIQDGAYRSQLIDAGFQNVERFRPAAIAAQYAELYRRVLQERQL